MPLTTEQRTAVVDYIVTNGTQAWKVDDALRSSLEELDETILLAVEDQVNNTVIAGKFGEVVADAIGFDQTSEMGDELELLPALIANALFEKKKKGADPEDDSDEDDADVPAKKPAKKPVVANMTDAEYMAALPPRIQSVVANAMRNEEKERQGLITKITANCGSNKKLSQSVANKTIDELREMDEYTTEHAALSKAQPKEVGYFGQGDPVPVANRNVVADNDFLPLPTMDWSSVK